MILAAIRLSDLLSPFAVDLFAIVGFITTICVGVILLDGVRVGFVRLYRRVRYELTRERDVDDLVESEQPRHVKVARWDRIP